MGVFIRAVVTGFGFSLGSALFKRVSNKLGLESETDKPDADSADGEDDDSADDAADEQVIA